MRPTRRRSVRTAHFDLRMPLYGVAIRIGEADVGVEAEEVDQEEEEEGLGWVS